MSAQTEARAIARWNPTGFGLGMEADTGGAYVRYEDHATTLAAKDAELVTVKAERDAAREYAMQARLRENAAEDARVSAVSRASRTEAQLAEANKALEPFARATGHFDGHVRDEDGVSIALRDIRAHHLRAARRAREQGGE